MKDAAEHWDAVYATKASNEVSWFQATPTTSLRLLERWASPAGSVLDVGSGASMLVESLLDAGWVDVTVLDISEEALNEVRSRLGGRAAEVFFITADVRSWQPHRTFDAWHDRAVFHFLVESTDRDRYGPRPPKRSHRVVWWYSEPSLPMDQLSAQGCQQLGTTPTASPEHLVRHLSWNTLNARSTPRLPAQTSPSRGWCSAAYAARRPGRHPLRRVGSIDPEQWPDVSGRAPHQAPEEGQPALAGAQSGRTGRNRG
jgi:hypothetical protein